MMANANSAQHAIPSTSVHKSCSEAASHPEDLDDDDLDIDGYGVDLSKKRSDQEEDAKEDLEDMQLE